MRNARLLSPGRTRGREQQRAAGVFAATRPPTKLGEHSVWCDLVLVERGCFPLLARGVVVVLTEDKVFLRVAATAFTLTVHLQDVVQVRHVVPKGVVELHVRLPAASSSTFCEGANYLSIDSPVSSSAAAQRLYRLTVTEHHNDLSAQLFHTLVHLLPLPALRYSAEETFTDDAVAAYLVSQPCSMLPLDLLDHAGLQEVEWIADSRSTLLSATSAARSDSISARPFLPLSAFDAAPKAVGAPEMNNESTRDGVVPTSNSARSLSSASPITATATTGHLRTIYVAPSPSFWRVPKHTSSPASQQDLNRTWSVVRGQASLPQAEVQPLKESSWPTIHQLTYTSTPPSPHPPASHNAVSHPPCQQSHRRHLHKAEPTEHSKPEVVGTSSRESSLMPDMCGLRPLTAPGSVRSSSISQSTDGMLKVQYGPTISG